MKDCKIEGRDKILYEEFYGAELLEMKFPEFWEKAVLEKKSFFSLCFFGDETAGGKNRRERRISTRGARGGTMGKKMRVLF